MARPRFRRWCWTAYQSSDDFSAPAWLKYAIWQREVGDAEHHEHLQGYFELSRAVDLSLLKAQFPGWHFESARGTQQQCIDYCSKSEGRVRGPWEIGERNHQGQRSDLAAVASSVAESKSVQEVAANHPQEYLKYSRGIERLHYRMHRPVPRGEPAIEVYWGDSGTGKSKSAWELYPNAYCGDDTKEAWMDGYDGQEEIIFDDFDCRMPLRFWLRLVDWHPLQAPVKGGYTAIRSAIYIFTTNKDPREWYDKNSAVLRRLKQFSRIYYFEQGCAPVLVYDCAGDDESFFE